MFGGEMQWMKKLVCAYLSFSCIYDLKRVIFLKQMQSTTVCLRYINVYSK